MACWEAVDALKAQLEQLRKTIVDATNDGVVTDSGRWVYSIDVSVLDKTPAQCLADVKAQAVEDAIIACSYCDCDGQSWRGELEQYAMHVRQSTKAGAA